MIRLIGILIVALASAWPTIAREIDYELELEQANSWIVGEDISTFVLEYRDSGGHLPHPYDTDAFFDQINNYELFLELLGSPHLDQELLKEAANRAMELIGPNRFFAAYQKINAANPGLRDLDIHRKIRQASRHRFVVANGMSINEDRMSLEEGELVFQRVMAELNSEAVWSDVLSQYQSEFEYKEVREIGGEQYVATPTRIGNMGKLITSRDRESPFKTYYSENDEMSKRALRANAGDVIVFRTMGAWSSSSHDGENWVDDWQIEKLVLFQIIEEYDADFSCLE